MGPTHSVSPPCPVGAADMAGLKARDMPAISGAPPRSTVIMGGAAESAPTAKESAVRKTGGISGARFDALKTILNSEVKI